MVTSCDWLRRTQIVLPFLLGDTDEERAGITFCVQRIPSRPRRWPCVVRGSSTARGQRAVVDLRGSALFSRRLVHKGRTRYHGAVGADHQDDLPGVERQIDTGKGGEAAGESDGSAELDDGGHGLRHQS